MNTNVDWHGIFPAINLPMRPDFSIHVPELKDLAEWLASTSGVAGIVCNGHAGEVSTLSETEYSDVIKHVSDAVAGKIPIISGIAAETPGEAVRQAQRALAAGAQGLLLMPPQGWLRFGYQKGAPEQFFRPVAQVGLPIVIHQYPSWTKAHYDADSLVSLSRVSGVAAVKMGERNLSVYEHHVKVLREKAPHMALLSCHDEYLFPTLVYDVDGALVGLASIIPELIADMFRAIQEKDLTRAQQLNAAIYPYRAAIYGLGEPTSASHARGKEVLRQLGRISTATVRPPVLPLTTEEVETVQEFLAGATVSVAS